MCLLADVYCKHLKTSLLSKDMFFSSNVTILHFVIKGFVKHEIARVPKNSGKVKEIVTICKIFIGQEE